MNIRPTIKSSELRDFDTWKEKAVSKYVKEYKKKLEETFGERAYQVKTKGEVNELESQLYYFSSIYCGQVFVEYGK